MTSEGGRAMKGGAGFFPKVLLTLHSNLCCREGWGGLSVFTAGKAKETPHRPLTSLAAFVREVRRVTSLQGAWANSQQSHPQVLPYTFTTSHLQPANPVAHRLKHASGDRHSCHAVFDFLRQFSPQGAFNAPTPAPPLPLTQMASLRWLCYDKW